MSILKTGWYHNNVYSFYIDEDRPQHIQTGTTANVRKYRAISTSEIEEMTGLYYFTDTYIMDERVCDKNIILPV